MTSIGSNLLGLVWELNAIMFFSSTFYLTNAIIFLVGQLFCVNIPLIFRGIVLFSLFCDFSDVSDQEVTNKYIKIFSCTSFSYSYSIITILKDLFTNVKFGVTETEGKKECRIFRRLFQLSSWPQLPVVG